MNFPKNLKLLRKHHKKTQADVAEALGIARGRWAKYEEGRAEPPFELLKRIAQYFELPVDPLLDEDIESAFGNKGPKGVEEYGEKEVEVIPGEATAGYLSGYGDPEQFDKLDRIRLPFLPSGKLRAFPVRGDSMWPVQDGSYVVGRWIEDADRVKNGRCYIVVSRDEGITYKRVWKVGENEGALLLVPDNERYSSYRVEGSAVMELWEYVCHISTQEYNPEELGKKGALEQLKEVEGRLEALREQLLKAGEIDPSISPPRKGKSP